ncbi:MAG: MFS transporter [Candidatus Nanopelagicales bacterium]|nr:MFS transporter [Candidatus Nanopelagicales bacterium]MDZ4248894.1 MFS transporter [Candidatus Nanopelagicales bacterium]MDZ7578870.1 MFS transporter [Candidatus Nanopelagicales bacterium]
METGTDDAEPRPSRARSGRLSRHPWLTRNLIVLSAVSLAQDAASEMLYPLLPILLTSVLGAPAVVVGLVEGVAEGASALVKYLSGRASDHVGRKPLVAAGYGLAALGKVVVAASFVWPLVLVGRVIDRVGKGTRGAPRDALLVEDMPATAMGRAFGFHRAADSLGAVIGPLAGLAVLAATGGDIRIALWVAIVPACISVLLVALTREHRRPKAKPRPTRPEESAARTSPAKTSRVKRSPLSRQFRIVVVVLALFALVNFPDALVLLRVSELGFSAAGVVAVYVVFNLSYAAISLPAGALADRWPKSRVYALGLVCFAIGYIGLGLTDGGWVVVPLFLIYGGFAAFTDGVGKAWISVLVPADVRGRAQGILQGLSGGAVLIAGLWAGLLWGVGAGSGTLPLLLSGAVAAVAAVALWTAGRRLG